MGWRCNQQYKHVSDWGLNVGIPAANSGHTVVRMSGTINMRMDINPWLGIVIFRVYVSWDG